MNTTIKKYLFLALSVLSFASCEKGLVFEEVPESIMNDVALTAAFGTVSARELFTDNVFQVNYNKYTSMVLTVDLSKAYAGNKEYTNNTTEAVTILGETVAPGKTITLKNNLTVVDDANAPEGKRYVVTFFASSTVQYTTPNIGHLFVESTFSDAAIKPVFVESVEPGKSQSIQLPVNAKQLIIGLALNDDRACKVTPVNGAPQLGVPGDYSEPRQYLVTNVNERPDGQGKRTRLYEIQVQILK